jgi:hypothetical protein
MRNLAFVALSLLALAGRAEAVDLLVAPAAATGACGDSATFARITDALACARQLRRAIADPIVVHVAAGTYRGSFDPSALAAHPALEVLPLVLNVANLALEGETVLQLDANGRPTDLAASGDTLVTTDAQLAGGQSLIHNGRTTDGMAGDAVAVSGLDLDGKGYKFALDPSVVSACITADRVSGFSISGNAVHGAFDGIVARHASGAVRGNYVHGDVRGIVGEGGTAAYPTVLDVEGNSVGEGAIAVAGNPIPNVIDADLGANPLAVLPIGEDASLAGANAMSLTVVGNVLASNNFGVRIYAIALFPQLPVAPTVSMSAVLLQNDFTASRLYGVGIDAGFDFAGYPPVSCDCQATLSGNSYAGGSQAPAFFGLSYIPNGVAGSYQYFTGSTYLITDGDNELAGFEWDNPASTPTQGPLGNTLLVGPSNAWQPYTGTKISK